MLLIMILNTTFTKSFANVIDDDIELVQIANNMSNDNIPSTLMIFLQVTKNQILPILYIIGLIIYLKKSKSSKKKKIMVSLISYLIAGTIYVILDAIVKNYM